MAGGLARAATLVALSLFCRHNRYTSDCPICSKGTVLDSARPASRTRSSTGSRSTGARKPRDPAPAYRGPFASAGPYSDDGMEYDVRLERVPGGLRLASWTAGGINRRAPVLKAEDLGALLTDAAEQGVLAGNAERLLGAAAGRPKGASGASPGRAGELREELRIEALDEDRVRVARWILRPNHGWELQDAPVLLPAARFAEALEASG